MSNADVAPNGRPLEYTVRPGHSRAAHRVHGYCAACPGIEPVDELAAWRARANAHHDKTEQEEEKEGVDGA